MLQTRDACGHIVPEYLFGDLQAAPYMERDSVETGYMASLMIVDDDEDFASAASTILRKAGHRVHIELDPDSATRRMEQERPDLVILDVMFPENPSGGFSLARAMHRDNGKLKGIPVLMLTAVNTTSPSGVDGDDIDGDWLGVSDFLEKPVDFDVLNDKVDALLRGACPEPLVAPDRPKGQ